MSRTEKWLLGIFASLCVAWVARVESGLSDGSKVLGILEQMNERLGRIERALDLGK